MADRDKKGRFIPGNKVNTGRNREDENIYSRTRLEVRRKKCRGEIVYAACSLLRPWSTLQNDLRDPQSSRLEYVLAKAVSENNTKFIQWVMEMAIGKPKQVIEDESKFEHKTILKRIDGSTIEYSLNQVDDDEKEENGVA